MLSVIIRSWISHYLAANCWIQLLNNERDSEWATLCLFVGTFKVTEEEEQQQQQQRLEEKNKK